jgi:hypothetical protein
MNILATQVFSEGKYKINIKFSDNTSGSIDLSHLAGKGVFKEWDVLDNFEKVHLDNETNAIKWNDTIELDALSLYLKVKGLSFSDWQMQNNMQH